MALNFQSKPWITQILLIDFQSALREYGLRLAADGTTRAKKRAVVAVARKLCVLLLSLWKNQTPYQPYPA
jgi:hypothetical protein